MLSYLNTLKISLFPASGPAFLAQWKGSLSKLWLFSSSWWKFWKGLSKTYWRNTICKSVVSRSRRRRRRRRRWVWCPSPQVTITYGIYGCYFMRLKAMSARHFQISCNLCMLAVQGKPTLQAYIHRARSECTPLGTAMIQILAHSTSYSNCTA